MTGPSASGSENGTPTSRTSVPAASRRCRIAADVARSGSPAVTYVTRPVFPSSRRRLKRSSSRDMAHLRQCLLDRLHVFVSTTREVHQQHGIASEFLGGLHRIGNRV